MISGTKQLRNDMQEIDQDFLALGMRESENMSQMFNQRSTHVKDDKSNQDQSARDFRFSDSFYLSNARQSEQVYPQPFSARNMGLSQTKAEDKSQNLNLNKLDFNFLTTTNHQ